MPVLFRLICEVSHAVKHNSASSGIASFIGPSSSETTVKAQPPMGRGVVSPISGSPVVTELSSHAFKTLFNSSVLGTRVTRDFLYPMGLD